MAKKQRTPEEYKAMFDEALEHLIPWCAARAPDTSNLTPSAMVDMMGPLRELENLLKEKTKLIHSVMDSKLTQEELIGLKPVVGENYSMKITDVSQVRLNNETTKAYLEKQGVLEDYQTTISYNMHKYEEKPQP